MPAKDIYHNAVKNALIKDSLKITAFCVVDDLLAAEILKSGIVLGFHHPSKQP